MTVRIVTDSACDLPEEVERSLNIEIVPLTVRFGDQEYVDRGELGVAEFWERIGKSKQIPTTAAPAPGAFEEAYRKVIAEGATGIVVICLTSKLSATMSSAELAARSITDVPIEVVDSKSASVGEGLAAIAAARHAASGADTATVAEAARSLADRTRILGALDTLEYLRKGGRVGAAKALFGELLSVKPCISIRDGEVAEAGKVRTHSKAVAWLLEEFSKIKNPEYVMVFHSMAPDAEEFLAQVRAIAPDMEIETGIMGPIVGTHIGPRALGMGWVEAK
ncbi:EDD domain protein, DegV family [Actinobacteria bacterium IMCC26256]|nr:EDD domain protein, DegV family [Actinobacteria bacterium IMCC26256]